MKLTVVVCAYNEERYLGECLSNLQKFAPQNLREIIVVDNASTDRTAEIAAGFEKVRVVTEPKKGLTRARQRGYLETQTELVAYVDADTRIPEDWYKVLNEAFSREPNLACLSGPYEYYDLTPWQFFWVKVFLRLILAAFRVNRRVVIGGNFAVRREALKKIGGFDTKIEFYGEDTNLARRIAEVGEARFDKKFFLRTSGRRFTKDGLFRTGLRYSVNYFWELFFKKPFSRTYRDIR